MKTVFVNPEKCIGCRQCMMACMVEHSQSKDIYQTITERPLPQARIHVTPGLHHNTSFPNKCRHCDPAPCVTVCPTGAVTRAELDTVVIDGNKCITCAMCAMVCPFDVLTFNQSADVKLKRPVALKCDHCLDRLKEGVNPACVEACKSGALEFGELNDLVKKDRSGLGRAVSVAVSQMKPEMVTLPENLKAWRDWGEVASQVNQR